MQARQMARRERKALGQEPPRGYTLEDVFRLWVGLKKGRIVSYQDERARLERYLIKPLGRRQLDEITAPLVIATVRPLDVAGHSATLKRVLMRARELLDIGVAAGYIEHNPIARVSRVFAAPIVTPMPAVHWSELPKVMQVMAEAPARIRVLFLISALTLLRPKEVAALRKEWIEGDVLSVPHTEMKKRRPHRVPLSPFALGVFAAAQKISEHPRAAHVFPGRRTGSHISSQALAKYMHSTSLAGKLVPHGLRSVGSSWMADHGIVLEVGESCLSHVVGSQVMRAYMRSDYFEARRAAMLAWSDYAEVRAREAGLLDGILEPDAVLAKAA